MNYDNTNTGAFFKNEQKQTANHPDYKGSINVEGVEYWLSGWIKPTKKDPSVRFMSLSVQPKNLVQNTQPSRKHDAAKARQLPPRADGGFDDMDSDIPF